MKITAICLLGSAWLLGLPASAACVMPTLVAAIPDGASASESELLETQAQVRAYIAAMDEYIACENEEMSVGSDDAADEYWFQMSSRIAAARAEVDAVASRFNAEVEAFRAARPQTLLPPPTLPAGQTPFGAAPAGTPPPQ